MIFTELPIRNLRVYDIYSLHLVTEGFVPETRYRVSVEDNSPIIRSTEEGFMYSGTPVDCVSPG